MAYVLSDVGLLSDSQIQQIQFKADEVRSLTLAFIRHQTTRLPRKVTQSARLR